MRILVVSHPSILDVNRRIYVELAKANHQVMLVVPSRWKNDFGRRPLRPEPLSDSATGNVSLRACRVVMAGKKMCHWAATRLGAAPTTAKPCSGTCSQPRASAPPRGRLRPVFNFSCGSQFAD